LRAAVRPDPAHGAPDDGRAFCWPTPSGSSQLAGGGADGFVDKLPVADRPYSIHTMRQRRHSIISYVAPPGFEESNA